MGNCRLDIYEQGTAITYTCDDIRDKIDDMKTVFRASNATNRILESGRRDLAYENYCEQLDDFLFRCNCKEIPLKCKKCSPEDHQGYFCRCEGRNINLAKQLRAKGMSTWNKKNGSGE